MAFVAASNLEEANPQLREAWLGSRIGLSIDSWIAVVGVVSWKVPLSSLAPRPNSPRWYFINFGSCDAQAFGDTHHYLSMVAKKKTRRSLRASGRCSGAGGSPIPINLAASRYVHMVEDEYKGIVQRNSYIVLPN